ncbi:hypothetical protein PanWU01x14_122080 [Parasponia andersonii]|uniref:Uncharacterized protein n=1 Tax=Parasponia andersonii TaxID=3476 RepID=A0A2P5CUK0_PARAD|nr:hypothetical protein PanWU01x14_122080 [Parasponia andersonii]
MAWPLFIGDSLVPPTDMDLMQRTTTKLGKSITKRFVFEASRIAQLKAKLVDTKFESGLPPPPHALK